MEQVTLPAIDNALIERLSPAFERRAGYYQRIYNGTSTQDANYQDLLSLMWLALVERGAEALTPKGEPLLLQTPSYIAVWASQIARYAIYKEQRRPAIALGDSEGEEMEMPWSHGSAPRRSKMPVSGGGHDRLIGERVGERSPQETIAAFSANPQPLIARFVRLSGGAVESADVVRLLDSLDDQSRQAAIAILAGYDAFRAGFKRRTVDTVRSHFARLAA